MFTLRQDTFNVVSSLLSRPGDDAPRLTTAKRGEAPKYAFNTFIAEHVDERGEVYSGRSLDYYETIVALALRIKDLESKLKSANDTIDKLQDARLDELEERINKAWDVMSDRVADLEKNFQMNPKDNKRIGPSFKD